MRSIKLVLALLIGTLLLNSCMKGDDTPREPSGTLALFNGYTPSQSVSYYLDGQPASPNTPYTTFQAFNNIAIGSRVLTITTSNNSSLADTTFTMKENTVYTSYIYGTSASPKSLLTEETYLTDLGDRAAIRLIHLANEVNEEVDFYIGDEKIAPLSNRLQETKESMKESQKFVSVDRNGTFDIWIKDKDGNKLDSLKNTQLRSGYYFSFIWHGVNDDDESNKTPLKLQNLRYN